MKYILLSALILTTSHFQLSAQDSSRDNSKLHFTAGVTFVTVPTYNISGTDTSFNNSLSVAPSLGLGINGFSAIYSPKFVTGGSNPGIYMHAVTLEYSQYDKPIADFAFEYTHMFFNNNPSVPYTPLNNEIYTALTLKKSWIRPKLAAGLGFGNVKATNTTTSYSGYDFGLSAGIGHNFSWDNNKVSYTLAPSIYLNGGTSQYFSFLKISQYIGHGKNFGKYTKKGIGANRGNGRRGGGGVITTTTTPSSSGSSFSLNNVEGNLESSVEIGSFTVRPTASLFIPVGTAAGSGVTSFWQISIQYKF